MSGSSIYAPSPYVQSPDQQSPPGVLPGTQINQLMAGAGNDPMAQYMQWLLAPQGQQQQPAAAPMMPVGVPLPQYAPTPPGAAPTGPVATGSTADPFGINAWALQQALAQQGGAGGGPGGDAQGAGGYGY
jgi:hypothetical protein